MNFEPQKFFIGLVDFFSIIMPGAMLVYLGKGWVAVQFCIGQGFPLDSSEAVMVFLFASYLLGHFVFLVGSVLDDKVYDPVRAWTDWGQISRRLAKGDTLSSSRKRRLAKSSWLFDKNADSAVMQAQRIKARSLQGLEAEGAVNAYQWCKAILAKNFPGGLLAVQRFEADSKFFRSFVVVLGVLTLFYGLRCKWEALICLIAILPALWRYIDQRFKATQQAYWFVIMLEAMKAEPLAQIVRSDGLTLAGGVVYRGKGKEVKFLLIESGNRKEWVLPKGHIEPGEDPRITSVREVKEETGHWARIVHWLEDAPLSNEPDAPRVRWFLLELEEESKNQMEESRQRVWLPLAEAKKRATFPESKTLLDNAAVRLGLSNA